jgi:parvulin-like peptidyl-prolyl isomerase
MKRSILTAAKLATVLAAPVLALSACKPPAQPTPDSTPAGTEPTATPSTPAESAPPAAPTLDSAPTQAEIPSTLQPIQLPEVVATVNGQNITKEQLQEIFNAALQGAGASVDSLSPQQQLQGYTQLLNDLITDKLVAEASSSEKVSDADVDAEIDKIKSQFPNPSLFDEELKLSGLTMEKMKENISTMLQQQRWMQSQIKSPDITDAAVQSFYDSNPAEFEQPETVEASHILFLVEPDATADTVKAKQDAASKAAERASKGEDFNTLAKELSDEPGADQSGGELGYFSKDRMVPEFANAAFSQQVGDIGQPVRSEFGWHVIKVTDKKAAGAVPFDDVKDQIRAFLLSTEQREAVQKILQNLKDSAKIETFLPSQG